MESPPWLFCRVQWDFLRSESISSAVNTFVTILTEARDRYVPSTLPTTKRPTVWWDRFC